MIFNTVKVKGSKGTLFPLSGATKGNCIRLQLERSTAERSDTHHRNVEDLEGFNGKDS